MIVYEDFSNDSETVMSVIYDFLKVSDHSAREKVARLNKTGKIKNKKLHSFILQESGIKSILRPIYRFFIRDAQKRKRISEKVKNRNIAKPFLNSKDKEAMSVLYSKDIKALSKLLNMPLDKSWSK